MLILLSVSKCLTALGVDLFLHKLEMQRKPSQLLSTRLAGTFGHMQVCR